MIVAGSAKDLTVNIHSQSDSSMVSTGTIKLVVRLESDDAEDGYFWDDAAGSWAASLPAFGDLPPLTHVEGALWVYALPAAATTGKTGDSISFTATDNLTEASATIVSESGEHVILGGLPATQTSVDAIDSAVDACHVSIAYDGSDIAATAWLERNGATVSSPTAITFTWHNEDGTTLFSHTDSDAEITGPDGQGKWRLQKTQALVDDQAYYVVVSITDASGTVTSTRGAPTVG